MLECAVLHRSVTISIQFMKHAKDAHGNTHTHARCDTYI